MTRVSLREAYDNKDVVAQIYAIRDTAESAEDTAEQAVTTANTASDHVDALVPQVEGAVQNANSASASAQASAQTVAGYENRLGAVEGDVVQLNTDVDGVESDLNAVTLRVTTAEGQIVTIQGRVTALETADGQNIKIDRINDYAVGLTGNQSNILGNKTFKGVTDSLNSFVCPALKWSLLYTRTNANYVQWLVGFSASSMFIASVGGGRINVKVLNGVSGRTYPQPIIKVCKKADGTEDVWMNADYGAWVGFDIIKNWIGYTTTNKYDGVSYTTQITSQDNAPVVGDTYISIVDSVDFNNEH